MGLVLNSAVEDGFAFSDTGASVSINYELLADLFDIIGNGLVPQPPYVILSLDTQALCPAIHSWPFFTSFCEIDQELYATSEDGIHQITGDDDDGEQIHTGIVLKTDFGVSNSKKIRAIILNGDIDDVVVKAEAGGISGEYTATGNRVYVSRDIIGRDWDLRITDFERLDGFEIVPVMGRRR